MAEILIPLLQRGLAAFGVSLTGTAEQQFLLFTTELQKWNKKINLTAITSDCDIAAKHFLDSLTLLPFLKTAGNLLDIGSGAGFPAIPLKIMQPDLTVVSVDAVAKKILFQRHIARLLHLHSFTPIHSRAESLAESFHGTFDVVVSRAFTDIVSFGRIAAPYLEKNGRILTMKGPLGKKEVQSAQDGLAEAGLRLVEVIELTLPGSSIQRMLVVIEKENEPR